MNSMTDPGNTGTSTSGSADYREGYADGYLSGLQQVRKYLADQDAVAESLRAAIVGAIVPDEHRDDCPDWCTDDHRADDERDDLITHMGDDHTDGTVRSLLDGHRLDIRVARTDCPSEGTVGVPSLYVRCEVELTTWEQAAELARAILDGFGYLKGADRG
jgi:hypothetical protein